ncbi:unnamed protein product [Moneuplotes crassus]|uniref:Uncharacterized protein n=1 Tax=Euplotes crassus TaxID=5936 RepID=A0AAD1XYR1_EUPCR|nr:unnamed protein product [Moneuplotes crassus]
MDSSLRESSDIPFKIASNLNTYQSDTDEEKSKSCLSKGTLTTNSDCSWTKECLEKDCDYSLENTPTGTMKLDFSQKSGHMNDRQKLCTKVAHLVNKSKKNSRDFDAMKISEAQKVIINKYNDTLGRNPIEEHTDTKFGQISSIKQGLERTTRNLAQNKSERSFIVSPQLNSIRKKKYKSKLGISKYKAGTPNSEDKFKSVGIFCQTNFINKENFSTMRRIRKNLFKDDAKLLKKQNLSQGQIVKFNIVDPSNKQPSVYKLNQSSIDSCDSEGLDSAFDRNNFNRPSMSSFRENEICEKKENHTVGIDMNRSLRKKSPKECSSFMASIRSAKFLPPKEENYESIESIYLNENSGKVNPQGYAFDTILPKQGLSKYQSVCNTNTNLQTEIICKEVPDLIDLSCKMVDAKEYDKLKEENERLKEEIERLKEEKEEIKLQRDLNYKLFMKAQKKIS